MEEVVETVKFEKYPVYKDSGVEWLGEVPEGWEVTRLGNIGVFSASGIDKYLKENEPEVKIINFTDIYGNIKGIVDSSVNFMVVTTPESNRLKNLVKKGDLVFLPSSETYEDLGLSALVNEELENTSFSYHVIRLQFNREVDHSFKKYLTNNSFASNQFSREGKGTTRKIIGRNVFKNIIIVIPPTIEQKCIATFLDVKTTQIDQAIAQKEKLIDLLREQRQIVINDVVTHGLNPNVKFKDSGVPWIGRIPEHWEVKRLKYFSYVQTGVTLGKTYFGQNLPVYQYLRVANVQSGYFKLDDMAEIKIPAKDAKKYFVKKGDILVTEGGDLDKLGRGTVWRGEIDNCLHQNHVFAIRVNTSIILPEYASMIMESDYGRKYFTNTANKTTNLASTNGTKLGNFPMILTSMEEQRSILEYIETTNQKIAIAISFKEKEIEKLKEYKATLINSAVTGKIKVS